jgi:hypothetical protein
MTDLGHVTRYLGVEFNTFPTCIFFSQHQYSLDMLQEFGMKDSKPKHVPLPPDLSLTLDMNSPLTDPHEYYRIVGKLIFLTTTRPDLAYSVSLVSRFMAQPQLSHLDAVKHILRYVKKTADYGLFYSSEPTTLPLGCTDADSASCPETRRSTSGYAFTMAGASITWQSKRQLTIARSSTESEYISLSTGTQ